ncbi:glutamate-1-semialdehyde 2,1-aminomutase [Desulfitispora alkaliphila]|uniref:glutamate-1-semialdehyde 2,1-aminomutase n=1 Tax=Desulfitispora alkaliphila TaxID=622674 RepID=UPI003D1EA1DB
MHHGYQKSVNLFEDAQKVIPGGVNSPVRAFKGVGGDPVFIDRGKGSKVYDVDGNEYVDYVASWGPLILGHLHPSAVKALEDCLQKGTSFGAPTELETEMAELLIDIMPSIEMVRMVNSGTEATMSALRLARGYTKRSKIVKFEGCYHGHADSLLIKAGSGALTLGEPTSPGVPENIANNTITASYNDLDMVKKIFELEGENIAAIILEPVAGNMGCIPPEPGFLEGLRKLTNDYGSLLIFDEVMCGFRVALGGAQARFNIQPDITCLGKVIGGGLPVGAYGGTKEIMEYIAPAGPIYQAGTLSGNPLAMSVGIATLKELQKPGVYEDLEQKTEKIVSGLKDAAKETGLNCSFNHIGAMYSIFFTKGPVNSFKAVTKSDLEMFNKFFHMMLKEGIYLAPSQFEASFMSTVHSDQDIEKTIAAAKKVFKLL